MARIFVGIDNGLSGALVALGESPGRPIAMSVMPTRGKEKGNEVDARAVLTWFRMIDADIKDFTVILETPGKFSKGVMAISSMWDSYGALRTVLECVGYRHIRITPAHWQKVMLPGCKRGDTKPSAALRARQLWPDTTFLPTDRSTKPHDGLIDAALIAEYGRILNL